MKPSQLNLLIQVVLTIMVISIAEPHLPGVLQWNGRGLHARLFELRREVLRTPCDILVLQEVNVFPSDVRISKYTPY